MATTLNQGSGERKEYTPHPEGNFMATCCDVFTKTVPNKYKGSVNNRGQVDTRDNVEKVCIAFMTTETIEIDGKPKARYVSFWGNASWGTVDYPSGTRKFVKAWHPKITDAIIANGFDLDKLIGQPAWLTVVQNTGKDGKVYANIVSAVTPPPGMGGPAIPADFVRHKDKEQQPAQASAAAASVKASPAPVAQADNEDDLPF
jgi:hypothetical protein